MRVMSALGFSIQACSASADTDGRHRLVMGIGGSAGLYEGPACMVRNFDDLFALKRVTCSSRRRRASRSTRSCPGRRHRHRSRQLRIARGDHGPRDGLPAVVGTVNATSRIPHGAMLRVDGDAAPSPSSAPDPRRVVLDLEPWPLRQRLSRRMHPGVSLHPSPPDPIQREPAKRARLEPGEAHRSGRIDRKLRRSGLYDGDPQAGTNGSPGFAPRFSPVPRL